MKTFKQFIDEMTRNIGKSYSFLNNIPSHRKVHYEDSKNNEIYPLYTGNNDITVHKKIDGNTIQYNTNDHNTKETLHKSTIELKEPTKELPFKHEEERTHDRVRNGNLPKHFVTNLIYNHFKESDYPLKTSDMQFNQGKNMWID